MDRDLVGKQQIGRAKTMPGECKVTYTPKEAQLNIYSVKHSISQDR